MPYYDGCFKSRPSPPREWTHTVYKHDGRAVDMSWHHAIPFQTLRDAWNGLIRSRHRSALQELMELVGIGDVGDTLDQMMESKIPGDEVDVLSEKLVWWPGNIVEGPSDREDDPKDVKGGISFDIFSGGLTPDEQRQHRQLWAIHYALAQLNSASTAVPDKTAKHIETTIADSKRHLRSNLIMFREQMWEAPNAQRRRWKKRSFAPMIVHAG